MESVKGRANELKSYLQLGAVQRLYSVSSVDHSETVEIARNSKTSFEFTFAVCGLDTSDEGVPFSYASVKGAGLGRST